jgi:ketosteroid isomerase-like protein
VHSRCLRRDEGKWLCVIDNSYGTDLLDAAA